MKLASHYFSAVLALSLLGVMTLGPVEQVQAQTRPGVAPMLQKVTPAVVNIAVTGSVAVQQNPLLNDPNFRRFFDVPDQPSSVPSRSVGSGVIIDADKGYILTNHHVVKDADEIEVTLTDKRRLTATLIGSDAGTDIALLKVEGNSLQALPMADSDTLLVGDFVVAIGNPFGLGQTVTTGIVSALDRVGISQEGYEDFIQTDASINPGNSGGALVDYNGNLVGINSAIIAPSGGNVGIGFAVPINMARSIVDQLLEFGEIRRGLLGVSITDLTPDVVEALGLQNRDGAIVQSVTSGSAAETAGLLAGDIIVGVNNKPIDSASDLRNTIGLIRAGETVSIDYLRGEDRLRTTAEISAGATQQVAGPVNTETVLQGASLGELSSTNANGSGVLVTAVIQDSRAWQNGLREGDVITAVNRQAVSSPAELQALLGDGQRTIALNLIREGRSLFLIMR